MAFAEILDPLSRKELSGISRRWQSWLARSAYVALVAFVVFRSWQDLLGRGFLGVSDYADLARGLFHVSFWGQLALVVPASVAAATDLVGREVRAGTLDLLLITPVGGRAIAVGKWKAAMAQGCSLVLCGLPVTAICVYLGGVGILELAWSACLLTGTAALSSAYALLYAVRHPGGDRAFAGALGTFLLWSLAPAPALLAGPFGMVAVFFAHPVWAAAGASFPLAFGPVLAHGWIGATLVSFLLARWLLWRTGNELLRWKPPRTEVPPPPSTLEVLVRAGLREPDRRPPVWERRPLLWKEMCLREAPWGKTPARRVLSLLAFYALSFLMILTAGDSHGTLHVLFFAFALLAAVHGASLFSQRREDRTWDVLLSSPLTPWEIVRTKLLAGILCWETFAVGAVSLVAAFTLTYRAGLPAFVPVLGTWTLFLGFAYVLGAAVSLRAGSLRGAAVCALGTLAFILLVLPWMAGALAGIPPGARWILEMPNPRPILESFSPGFRPREPAFAPYAGFHLAAIPLLLASMVRGVRRKPAAP